VVASSRTGGAWLLQDTFRAPVTGHAHSEPGTDLGDVLSYLEYEFVDLTSARVVTLRFLVTSVGPKGSPS
jgi:hypothetical protein